MRVYHTTDQAAAILAGGFKDATGHYMTPEEHTGVWLADTPLNCNEGAKGKDVLAFDFPDDIFAAHEWVEDFDKGYREALIPAEIVNQFGPPVICSEDELEACPSPKTPGAER